MEGSSLGMFFLTFRKGIAKTSASSYSSFWMLSEDVMAGTVAAILLPKRVQTKC